MAQYLINFLYTLNPNGFSLVEAIISLILVIGFAVAFYVLKSIGVYKLAKNHGIDKAFMAWIPFAWIYLLCLLVKEFLFFGTPYGKIALPICIIFSVYGGLTVVYYAFAFLPEVIYLVSGREVFYTNLVITLLEKLGLLISLLSIVKVVVEINLYIVLFRKFWPQYYIIASVMSFFGLFPIFVFVIRNKIAMSFEQYVNSMKTNSSKNAYRETSEPKRSKKDDPFSEFGDDDPFSDF